jgi:hypothetical protein
MFLEQRAGTPGPPDSRPLLPTMRAHRQLSPSLARPLSSALSGARRKD